MTDLSDLLKSMWGVANVLQVMLFVASLIWGGYSTLMLFLDDSKHLRYWGLWLPGQSGEQVTVTT
ncbi:MAG: hypothetical protein ACREO8_13105 [Luteimonas sp.]